MIKIDTEALADVLVRRLREELDARQERPVGWLDVESAAVYLSSTESAIRTLVKRDAIPVHRSPVGRLLFDRDELDQWVLS